MESKNLEDVCQLQYNNIICHRYKYIMNFIESVTGGPAHIYSIPDVPKKTIHCLILCNVKAINSYFNKIKGIPLTED